MKVKELYEANIHFKEYVDSFCVVHNMSIETAFEQQIVKRVAIYYNFNMKEKVKL